MKKLSIFLYITSLVATMLVGCGTNNEVSNDNEPQEVVIDVPVEDDVSTEDIVDVSEELDSEKEVQNHEEEYDELSRVLSRISSSVKLEDFRFENYQGEMKKYYGNTSEDLILLENGYAYDDSRFEFEVSVEDIIYFHQHSSYIYDNYLIAKLTDGITGLFFGKDNKYYLVNGVDAKDAIYVARDRGKYVLIYNDLTVSSYEIDVDQEELSGEIVVNNRTPLTNKNDVSKIIFHEVNGEKIQIQYKDGRIVEAHEIIVNWADLFTPDKGYNFGSDGIVKEGFEIPVEDILYGKEPASLWYKTTGIDNQLICKNYTRTVTINLPESYTINDINTVTGGDYGTVIEFSDKTIWSTRNIEYITDINTFDLEKDEFLSKLNKDGKLNSYSTYDGEYFYFLSNDGYMYIYSY